MSEIKVKSNQRHKRGDMMSAAGVSPPICTPGTYDPAFKVPVYSADTLWPASSQTGVGLEMAVLCSQLDVLCRQELHQCGSVQGGNVSSRFEGKALILLDRLQQLLLRLPASPDSLQKYLNESGLAKLYPRAATYIAQPYKFYMEQRKTHMDVYYTKMASLHQVISLAKQVSHDVCHLHNHKYIAHQLALLYQSLSNLGDVVCLKPIKQNIEDNFSAIKEALNSSSGESCRLAFDQAHWLTEITDQIQQVVISCPPELTSYLELPVAVLSQLKP